MLPEDNIGGDDKLADHLITHQLPELTLEGNWKEVVEMYEKCKEAHTTDIKKSTYMGTALHVAIKFNKEDVVKRLVNAIIKHGEKGPNDDIPTALVKENERGHTPLHLAASRDFPRLCKCIVEDESNNRPRLDLVTKRNKQGETPLFVAARNGSKAAFAYLYHIAGDNVVPMRDLVRDDGDSILHLAIRKELFDLAVMIAHCYRSLATYANEKDGSTPLKVLATRPSAFISGSSLSWRSLILYNCTPVEPLDAKRTINKLLAGQDGIDRRYSKFPVNYETICGFGKLFIESTFGKPRKDPHDTEDPPMRSESGCFPLNYGFSLSGVALDEIRETKKKHTWSRQLLDALMEHAYEAYTGSGVQPRDMSVDPAIIGQEPDKAKDSTTTVTTERDKAKDSTTTETTEHDRAKDSDSDETPLLLAARNGICEMVTEIISKLPSTVHEKNSKRENVLLVAVLYRQPDVLETLKRKAAPEVWNSLILAEDEKENTMLHLAARAQGDEKHKQIAGSALQMMWDIKWYEYIKSLMPKHYYFRSNSGKETARDIFKGTHGTLIEKSNEWLKDTSESCSVVAALVAGVSFATATTVPGGNDDNGKAPLEGKPAFDAFAISSLIGLCFSATGLIMFLTILTSRKEARDFRRGLPMKLLLGLSSLFLSIVAMLVSFCSGHFFNINHKYKDILLPLYAATSLPVAFYAFAQLPLYIDLLTTIFAKVPWAKDKGDTL